MQKDKPVRMLSLISAILSALSAIFGCICAASPSAAYSLYKIVFGDPGLSEVNTSIGDAMPFVIITALLPLGIAIIALINTISGTYSKTKGTVTIVITVIYYIAMILLTNLFHTISLNMCAKTSIDMLATLNIVNTTISVVGWFKTFAVMLIVSASSIEIYASEKLGD